jgi:fumarate reductase (CoM/CoB) subunit A
VEIVANLLSYKRLLKLGIDIQKEKIEIAPHAHTTLGGVKIDPQTRTTINGLFACGESTGNVHGANRLAGHSFLDTQVFGAKAGKRAAEFAKEVDFVPLDQTRLEAETKKILSYIGIKKDGIPASTVKYRIAQLAGEYLGPIRKKEGLEKMLAEIDRIEANDMPRVDAQEIQVYNNDWMEAIEVRHMLNCAGMVTRCALFRQESRGSHFREDFPYMDNENPVKHTVVQLRDRKMEVTAEDVNLTKFRPAAGKESAF